MKRKTKQTNYLHEWQSAMRYGLLNGRPYSEVCIGTYARYVGWLLAQYGGLTIESLKAVLVAIPIDHYAKRKKLFESLVCFAKFLVEEKGYKAEFLAQMKKYRPRRHKPERKRTVDPQDLELLIHAARNPLDKLIVILLSQTGLRATEAANLRISDLDLEKKILTVQLAKWGKTRKVGLTQRVIDAITAYLPVRPNYPEDYLLINCWGNPMDRFGIRNRLYSIGRRANVKVNPHALRRAFVTINANKGRPLVMLQIACGHNNIATTRSYCMTTEEETVTAMQDWD